MDEKRIIAFVVPKTDVKAVKTALETASERNLLDKGNKIQKNAEEVEGEVKEDLFIVPTSITISGSEEADDIRGTIASKYPSLADALQRVKSIAVTRTQEQFGDAAISKKNVLLDAIRKWLDLLPPELLPSFHLTIQDLISVAPTSYSIYPPMLLLPTSSFQDEKWKQLLSHVTPAVRYNLHANIAQKLEVTHIALNAPIPTHDHNTALNVLRSPVNLTPLIGDFGPACSSLPTQADFDRGFWVTARQNGITQTWAPQYTMFSRGNISEKARILKLASVQESVSLGRTTGRKCTAIDLYAGIGYFAFSYVKAGFDKVLCWELNPWSVEGLRRGANANRWEIQLGKKTDTSFHSTIVDLGSRLVVFEESNEHARARILNMRSHLPPIRHINCGLLPSSKGCWETAVFLLDPHLGGWIHIHENIASQDIAQKSEEILCEIRVLSKNLCLLREESNTPCNSQVLLEHVERVKTYAPGVIHCVLDIRIVPQ
jgi:tRNA wybutosine-synthesizing protein 2